MIISDYNMWRFMFLQISSWIFLAYLFVAQVIPVFDYDIGIAMSTQESQEIVSPIGVAFYKGFIVSDTLAYAPLMAAGLLLHLAGGYEEASRLLLAAAYGITIYWPLDCLAAVEAASGYWNLPKEAEGEYWMALPVIAAWGCVSLFILLSSVQPTNQNNLTRGHGFEDNGGTEDNRSYWKGPGVAWTICLWGGILAPFLFLCNDMVQCALHREYPWRTTTISELAAQDQAHACSQYLLLASAISLICFGFGVSSQVDRVVGILQIVNGICNLLTASKFRLTSVLDDQIPLECLPMQSKVHVFFVATAVLTSISSLFYDMMQARRSWALVTGVLAIIVVMGVSGSYFSMTRLSGPEDDSSGPSQLGLLERLSVYSIQLWTFLFGIDSIYRTHYRCGDLKAKVN